MSIETTWAERESSDILSQRKRIPHGDTMERNCEPLSRAPDPIQFRGTESSLQEQDTLARLALLLEHGSGAGYMWSSIYAKGHSEGKKYSVYFDVQRSTSENQLTLVADVAKTLPRRRRKRGGAGSNNWCDFDFNVVNIGPDDKQSD
ncbi:unnamed protein product [Allacma fusca]|uniref:Uncharacterized protein n=1 Tax=Allacma fusca TaxID=39272 RepID=A0A8J2JVQ9_9HEXA|nr:unnamed protein product [Allacma fusca]